MLRNRLPQHCTGVNPPFIWLPPRMQTQKPGKVAVLPLHSPVMPAACITRSEQTRSATSIALSIGLLHHSLAQDLNPMLEAFRILDPNGTGSADLSRMRAMMDRLWPQDKVGGCCGGV